METEGDEEKKGTRRYIRFRLGDFYRTGKIKERPREKKTPSNQTLHCRKMHRHFAVHIDKFSNARF